MKNLKYKVFSLIFCITAILSLVALPSQAEETTGQIKNVIYLMPDGGGYGQYDFANAFKQSGGFDAIKCPNATQRDASEMFIADYLGGSVTTRSANTEVTDSAAGGTAYAIGQKTNHGYLAVDTNRVPRATLLEAAQEKGMATGLVSQVYFYHASPAAFSAHWYDRNDYATIATQVENQGIDVVLTGGYSGIEGGSKSIETPRANGYTIINNKEELAAIAPGDKVWGNLWSGTSPMDYCKSDNEPAFADIVDAAITALSDDEDGFFLFVEVSHTDNHGNSAVHAASEYNVFSDCFEVAVNYAKENQDTIVIGIPDHDTGGMVYNPELAPSWIEAVAAGKEPENDVWETTNHTSQNVPCFIYVPEGVDTIPGLNPVTGDTPETRDDYVIDNTAMAPHVESLLGFDLDATTSELFVDVTEIGTYTPEGRFEFASGNKYMYPNQSVYYEDGRQISTDGRISVYIDGKFYVPSVVVEENDWNYTGGTLDGLFGTGTKEDPYLINNSYDFIEFTNNLISGETYAGKYFKQTRDIDLTKYSSVYNGVESNATFAGIYNGNGNSITAVIETKTDSCVFPVVTGTIMNLGTKGSITSKGNVTAGIARTLDTTGKIVNCYSTMELSGNFVAGLVYNQYGVISNSYFGGSIKAEMSINAVALKHGNGIFKNCYYSTNLHQFRSMGIIGMENSIMLSSLADNLNSSRIAAAATAGVPEEEISYWKQDENSMPYLYKPDPIVESVTVTPSVATVKKGESIQLSAEVTGQYNPSQAVGWELSPASTEGTAITSGGLLTVSESETATTFTVIAKSKVDGSKVGICEITVTE